MLFDVFVNGVAVLELGPLSAGDNCPSDDDGRLFASGDVPIFLFLRCPTGGMRIKKSLRLRFNRLY